LAGGLAGLVEDGAAQQTGGSALLSDHSQVVGTCQGLLCEGTRAALGQVSCGLVLTNASNLGLLLFYLF
jgi:hypothetical protein